MAVQPLDLLPPADVTFEDYACAVLRAEQIVNPDRPRWLSRHDDRRLRRRAASSSAALAGGAEEARHLSSAARRRRSITIPPSIAASRANAYRFLDDNRRDLFIPFAADVVVTDAAMAQKLTVSARRLPKQLLLQYIWREDVRARRPAVRPVRRARRPACCAAATLALDIDGNVLSWQRKPGTLPLVEGPRRKSGPRRTRSKAGKARREAFLDALAARIAAGRIGDSVAGSAIGLLEKSIAPMTSYTVDGTVRFGLSPHIGIRSDEDEEMGERPWTISS